MLLADAPEVVEERPAIHIKLVFDVLEECPLPRLRDMVVGARVALLGIRDADSHLVLLLPVRKREFRLRHERKFDEFRLNTSVVKPHRFRATVSMYEPLAQITWHFQIDVIVAHKLPLFGVCYKGTEKRARFYESCVSFKICYDVGRYNKSCCEISNETTYPI